jgi:hypothetical protein
MTEFTTAVESELQMSGMPFDQADLIAFCECDHMLIDDAPDPALWAERFAAFVRDRMDAVTA